MRVVTAAADVEEAHARCRSESEAAFGSGAVYVEELIARARHIEIQIIGDGTGAVSHVGERECSVQRRHQKLVELAPSPTLRPEMRHQITAAAVRLAESVDYRSLGTFEFLQDATNDERFFFIEANPRLQVEHTVTEEVSGIDLVRSQLRIAGGETLAELGLEQASIPAPRGFAIQARVNTEQMLPDGNIRPTGGELTAFHLPAGPGVRVDTFGYPGYRTNPNFDSLLAKVIAYAPSGGFETAVQRLSRALSEFVIRGLETNAPFLGNVITHADFTSGGIYTRWVDDNVEALIAIEASAGEATAAAAGGAGADAGQTGSAGLADILSRGRADVATGGAGDYWPVQHGSGARSIAGDRDGDPRRRGGHGPRGPTAVSS